MRKGTRNNDNYRGKGNAKLCKLCKRTVKERVYCTKEKLVAILHQSVPKHFLRVRNISHQYRATDSIKASLTSTEVFIHTK